jgi:hypothetical protein
MGLSSIALSNVLLGAITIISLVILLVLYRMQNK